MSGYSLLSSLQNVLQSPSSYPRRVFHKSLSTWGMYRRIVSTFCPSVSLWPSGALVTLGITTGPVTVCVVIFMAGAVKNLAGWIGTNVVNVCEREAAQGRDA